METGGIKKAPSPESADDGQKRLFAAKSGGVKADLGRKYPAVAAVGRSRRT